MSLGQLEATAACLAQLHLSATALLAPQISNRPGEGSEQQQERQAVAGMQRAAQHTAQQLWAALPTALASSYMYTQHASHAARVHAAREF